MRTWNHLQRHLHRLVLRLVLALLQKVDQLVDTAEHISDVVEAVADKVDKVVEELEDDLPEGSQLRKTLDYIENIAERVEKDAHTAGDFIDKSEKVNVLYTEDDEVQSDLSCEYNSSSSKFAAKCPKHPFNLIEAAMMANGFEIVTRSEQGAVTVVECRARREALLWVAISS
nr:hypothetical protein Ccrd_023257 [Tanacetum cinerariifolium]